MEGSGLASRTGQTHSLPPPEGQVFPRLSSSTHSFLSSLSSCPPAGLHALQLPSFKTQESTQSQQHRHRWFNGWVAYTLGAGSWVTPTRTVLPGQQALEAGFAPRGRGWLSVTGATEPGGLIGYQGNQQSGRPLTAPLIRTIMRRAWDKSRRKEGQVRGWMGGKPWWSRGGTESKRTTIFSGQNLWTRGRGDLPQPRPPSFN